MLDPSSRDSLPICPDCNERPVYGPKAQRCWPCARTRKDAQTNLNKRLRYWLVPGIREKKLAQMRAYSARKRRALDPAHQGG